MAPLLGDPPTVDNVSSFDPVIKHGHQDLVQAVAFNSYGDRCATGSVDGKIRVFNRHKDGIWRHCDNWSAHGGEILELQWLPPTIYPNLLGSLGIEGRFKLWAEDPAAAPGRRFSNATGFSGGVIGRALSSHGMGAGSGSAYSSPPASTTPPQQHRDANPKAAFETRSPRSTFRSFSMRHVEDSRHTYLALLAADGRLTVYENEQPENLTEWTQLEEFTVFTASARRPARGEEVSFRVRFDPNPDVCYTALRAGVPADSLGLVVAAMDGVRLFRTRDVVRSSLGVQTPAREFYLAADLGGHAGLVRDVAWAPGNFRGYDIVATACQDGYVRVFKVQALGGEDRGWTNAALTSTAREIERQQQRAADEEARRAGLEGQAHPKSGIRAGLDQSRTAPDRRATGLAGQIRHAVTEIGKLDSHRTPVWRVGFDDDGQILGSVGDEGKLMCYRQTPDGSWAKSSELAMVKMRMAAP